MAVTLIEKDEGGRCPFFLHRDTFLLQVAQNPELSGATVKAAIILAVDFYNRTLFLNGNRFGAWPTIEKWASRAGLHTQTVKKAVKELSEQGHVDVRRPKTKGEGNHNYYALVVKCPNDGSQATTKSAHDDGSQPTTNKASKGSHPTSKLVANDVHKLVDEPLDGAEARSRAPQASEQDDGSNHIEDKNLSQSDKGDSGAHERPQSPITASVWYTYTEADLELDRVYDGQAGGDCEDLDADEVQEIDLSEIEALRAEEETAARFHDDQGRQSWGAISRRVLEICGDSDDVAVFLTIYPRYWPSKDLIHAFADAANAMPAKWRIGSRWKVQEFVKDDPEGEEEYLKAYAKVTAAVADLASRLASAPITKTAVAQAVANG